MLVLVLLVWVLLMLLVLLLLLLVVVLHNLLLLQVNCVVHGHVSVEGVHVHVVVRGGDHAIEAEVGEKRELHSVWQLSIIREG